MLTFAHIPTSTTVNKVIELDVSKSRGVTPATAPTMIGADIETGRVTLRSGSGCLTNGVHLRHSAVTCMRGPNSPSTSIDHLLAGPGGNSRYQIRFTSTGTSRAGFNVEVCALGFFYGVTLGRTVMSPLRRSGTASSNPAPSRDESRANSVDLAHDPRSQHDGLAHHIVRWYRGCRSPQRYRDMGVERVVTTLNPLTRHCPCA